MTATPCADCKTTGGRSKPGRDIPSRTSGTRFGLEGEICDRCYMKHYKRQGRAMLQAGPQPPKAKQPDRSNIDPTLPQHQKMLRIVASQFMNQGMDFDDLVGEGQIALIKACRGFNPDLKIQFDTYANAAIRSTLGRQLANKVPHIRIPEHLRILIKNGTTSLKNETTNSCLQDALAARSRSHVFEDQLGQPLANVAYARESNADQADQAEAAKKAEALLKHLPDVAATVLRLRFGIGSDPHTLQDIARVIGTSYSTARRAESKAIEQLREVAGVAESRRAAG